MDIEAKIIGFLNAVKAGEDTQQFVEYVMKYLSCLEGAKVTMSAEIVDGVFTTEVVTRGSVNIQSTIEQGMDIALDLFGKKEDKDSAHTERMEQEEHDHKHNL